MPRVGKKHFSYDDEGYAAAQAEADRTGKSMITGYARGCLLYTSPSPRDGT